MGLSRQAAMRQAIGAVFDYSDVSYFTNAMRRLGVYPFATYPVKVLRAMPVGALRRPQKFSKADILLRNVRAPGMMHDQENVHGVLQALAGTRMEWMAKGEPIPLPTDDPEGRQLWYNMAWELPWGPLLETGLGFHPESAVPLAQGVQAAILGRDLRTDRPLYKNADSEAQKAAAIAQYLSGYGLPPVLMGTIRDAKDRKSLWVILGHWMGLRTYALSEGELRGQQGRAFREAAQETRRQEYRIPRTGKPEVTDAERRRARLRYQRWLEENRPGAAAGP